MRFTRVAAFAAAALLAGACSDEIAAPGLKIERQTITINAPLYATAVSGGSNSSCAVIEGGTVVCWANDSIPTVVTTGVRRIAGRSYHTCGIKTADDTLVCWGYNAVGQTDVPPGLGAVLDVALGDLHTCAVKADGTVVCWGGFAEDVGQLQVPAGLNGVLQITAGLAHNCAVDGTGAITCWGAMQGVPVPGPVRKVIAGAYHTCAIKMDYTVACWGFDASGQATVPEDLGPVEDVSAGFDHTCASRVDNTVVCWGDLGSPELGIVQEIASGWSHACAVDGSGLLTCWGNFVDGQVSILEYQTGRYAPSATLVAPASANAGAPIHVTASNARVITPNYTLGPIDARIEYSFDCGNGPPSAFSPDSIATCMAADHGYLQTISVKVRDMEGDETTFSSVVVVIPDAPAALAATESGNAVTLDWSADARASFFLLSRRSNTSGVWTGWEPVGEIPGSAGIRQLTDSLPGSGAFKYAVRACMSTTGHTSTGRELCSPFSNVVDVSLAGGLASPTAASATVASFSAMDVTWTDASTTETRYEVTRRSNDGTGWTAYLPMDTLGANAVSFESTGLEAGVFYQFAIRACNAGGCAPALVTSSLRISPTPPRSPDTVVPELLSSTELKLTWNDASANEASFQIERRKKSAGVWGAWQSLPEKPANSTSSFFAELDGREQQYRVRACNTTGCSRFVTGATVEMP